MTTAQVLKHLNADLPAEIHPDKSAYAIGVVLLQRDLEDSEWVVANGSRKILRAECNYTTTERECFAIVWARKKYRYYLVGRIVTVRTDHHSLCWLLHIQSATSGVVRWA